MMDLANIIARIKQPPDVYVKQLPFVDDNGIYVPLTEYVPEGCASNYKCIITKELFMEAYNKWVKNN
jgi:hypothetical protein